MLVNTSHELLRHLMMIYELANAFITYIRSYYYDLLVYMRSFMAFHIDNARGSVNLLNVHSHIMLGGHEYMDVCMLNDGVFPIKLVLYKWLIMFLHVRKTI